MQGSEKMIIKVTEFNKYIKVDRDCIVNESDWLSLRQFVLKRDNFTCVDCGDIKGPFEADHVMPKSRGGLDTESNLVCACRSCNRSKKDKTPEEWGGFKRG